MFSFLQWLPSSPHYYISIGQISNARKVLERLSAENGLALPPGKLVRSSMVVSQMVRRLSIDMSVFLYYCNSWCKNLQHRVVSNALFFPIVLSPLVPALYQWWLSCQKQFEFDLLWDLTDQSLWNPLSIGPSRPQLNPVVVDIKFCKEAVNFSCAQERKRGKERERERERERESQVLPISSFFLAERSIWKHL